MPIFLQLTRSGLRHLRKIVIRIMFHSIENTDTPRMEYQTCVIETLSLSAIITYRSSRSQTPWTETTRKNAVPGRHTWRTLIATRSSYRRMTTSTDCSTCSAWISFALFLQFDPVAASVPECLLIFLRVCWMVIRFTASRKLLLGKLQWFSFNSDNDIKQSNYFRVYISDNIINLIYITTKSYL